MNRPAMLTIFYAGDSTCQYNNIHTFPQTGIGQVLGLYLKNHVRIENHAKNGRSTKSFLEEGRLSPIRERIGAGDFLFIQFGHNDEKAEDPARYTDPFGTYQENLSLFIKAAEEKDAHPVLITPLARRWYEEDGSGNLRESAHTQYVRGMKELGERMQVPVIDLFSKSRRLLQEAGPEETLHWYMQLPAGTYPAHPEGKEDNTHLQYRGAVIYAGCIAEGLRELGGIYADLVLPEGERETENYWSDL